MEYSVYDALLHKYVNIIDIKLKQNIIKMWKNLEHGIFRCGSCSVAVRVYECCTCDPGSIPYHVQNVGHFLCKPHPDRTKV